jgi:hypothetical protein
MVLTCLPRVVQERFFGKAELRSAAQRRHLAWLLTAILLGVGPKLKRVAQCSRGARHRTSLGFFLNRSDWDEAGLLATEAQRALRRLRVRKGDVLDLILDDTRCVKRGRKMADLSKLWDHAHQRFGHGHAVLTAAIHVRGVTLPWALRVWQPKKVAGAGYRKLTDLAAELVASFTPPPGVRVRVLFDAAYLCPQVTQACKDRGFTWYSVAARNRRFWRLRCERTEKIEQFAPGVVKHRGRRVRLRRSFGWRWTRVAGEHGMLPKIGAVQLVFSKRPRDPARHLLAVATNDLSSRPREVLAIYERRWNIEVLFKELRTLGLGAYQLQHRNGIRRHLHVVCLAHLALTHHAIKAVGAQATVTKTIPVPPLRQRLDHLRRCVLEDQADVFANRIRQPKVRRRVREFLKLAA